ncbi:uncharacterized protein [Diadema setosum]|uniref:uncharacterized protein n=1 Tax=Diadema setosum TaxID=31175 RepID=UPI003B3AA47F
MKCWIYQHFIAPKIQWKLLIYDVPLSQVERMEVCVAVKLRRWLGVSRVLTDIALFCHQSKLHLPMEGLVSSMKKTIVNATQQLQQSSDEVVSRIQPKVRCGRKWNPDLAIERAEGALRMEDLVRGQFGRQGLGSGQVRKPVSKLKPNERRAEIVSLAVREHDDIQYVRAVQMSVQGAWTSWENVRQRKLSWRNLFDTSPRLLQFLLGATYDTTPSPVNLKRWGIVHEDSCNLCKERATTTHILAGCPTSLGQGRYTWRHNRVLRVIAEACSNQIGQCNIKPIPAKRCHVNFVREGEQSKTKSQRAFSSCLDEANDWKILAHLDKKLVFPQIVFVTSLRPDIVILSEEKRQVFIIELTVPDEAGMQRARERKRDKYEDLVLEIQKRRWKVDLWTIEVGCRGFSNGSLSYVLRRLGCGTRTTRRVEGEACSRAERASFHLWLMRNETQWSTPTYMTS